ncbi:MAG: hypothetical protein HWN68_20615 [Desulfobacterales bacterium]|nr:hypothetical protein [Desulfobacterales bacterium]
MYVQFKEMTYEKPIPKEVLDTLRKSLKKHPLAFGIKKGKPNVLAMVLLDLPKVKWYMSGSPIVALMADSQWTDELKKALDDAIKQVVPLLKGKWHIQNLGVPSEQLNGKSDEYDWDLDTKKVHKFQKDVEKGKFIDETGSPCDTCVDEQQFYGCPFCDFNPLADEMMEEEDYDPEYD